MTTPQIIEPAPELVKILDEAWMEWEFKQSLIISFTPFFKQAKTWNDEAFALSVTDENDTEWMQKARELRLNIKDVRCNGENTRKKFKEWFLNWGRAVDAVYKVIEELTKPAEEHLLLQEKYAELQEQKRKEERKSARIIELSQYGVDPQGYDLVNMNEENYQNLVNMSKIAFDKKKEDEARAEQERIDAEKKRKEEEDRIRKENEDLKRKNELIQTIQSFEKLEDLKNFIAQNTLEPELISIANKHLATIQEKQDAIIETERLRKQKEDAEKKAKSAEQARQASQNAHEKWLRQQAEDREKERKKKEKEEWDAEQARKKAEREANRAPDKVKLNKLADDIDAIVFPTCKTEEGEKILQQTTVLLSKVTKYIRDNADKSV